MLDFHWKMKILMELQRIWRVNKYNFHNHGNSKGMTLIKVNIGQRTIVKGY